jgi:TorA maturation chaperone TorD
MALPQARTAEITDPPRESSPQPETVWRTGCLAQLAHAELLQLVAEILLPPASGGPRLTGSTLLPVQAADLGKACGLKPDDTAALAEVLALLRDGSDDREDDHERLFGSGGACPPHEAAYVRQDRRVLLADLTGAYRACGFEPPSGGSERADHITVELQFMARLLVLAAEAASAAAGDARSAGAGSSGERETACRAAGAFARRHLDAWLPAFVARLRAVATDPLHRRTADLLAAVWTSLGRHGPLAAGGV